MRSREPWRLPAGQSRAVPFLQAAVLFAALCIFARSRRAAGRFDDLEWPPRALWPYSAEKYFKFRVCRGLRAACRKKSTAA